MKLAEIVPWGRTLTEYQLMFGLTDTDLSKRILGVGDGPASFNAQMTAKGYSVASVDPIYAFSADEIRTRITDTYQIITEQVKANAHQYNWTTFRNVDQLVNERMEAMNLFLADYEDARTTGRYLNFSLPALPFADQSFDLALCSHLLFLYSEQLSEHFHLESILELLRIATEIRIFPLITLDNQPSPYLARVLDLCQQHNLDADIVPVDYHFQKGAYQLLRIKHKFQ